jgi:hypothetical protein
MYRILELCSVQAFLFRQLLTLHVTMHRLLEMITEVTHAHTEKAIL